MIFRSRSVFSQSFENPFSQIPECWKIFFHGVPNRLIVDPMVGMPEDITHTTISLLIDFRILAWALVI